MAKEVVSICPYCAHACQLKFSVENNKVKKVSPVKEDPVSFGRPCVKGLTLNEVVDKGRILKPMIRKNGKLQETTWNKALEEIAKKLKEFAPEEIFFGTSGKITNEDNYVIQKFARAIIGTNNVDNCCGRLCHIPTVVGFKDCLGIGASPGYLKDIEDLDVLLIIGSNPISNHPVAFERILKMKKVGGKVIVVAPMYSDTAKITSDLTVLIYPGTEVAFFNGLMNEIIKRKKYFKNAEKLENFETLVRTVEPYTLKRVSQICQTSERDLEKAVELIINSEKFGVMHGMGLTQHVNGVENVHSLVNLVLLMNGKIVTGRGEVNVQGGGDMLGNPLPLQFFEAVNLKKLKKLWNCVLPEEKGMNLVEAISLNRAKMAFVSSFNPAHSLPALTEVHNNLKKIFLVQMESYFNLTTEFADVVLPTPILFERTGSVTNGERRVRYVRKVVEPKEESLPEWKIYCKLAEKLGKELNYKNEREIFQEIKELIVNYSKISVSELYGGKDQFALKKIKFKRFVPEKFEGVDEIRSKKFPFILFTFRSKFSFLTDEMTGKSETLNKLAKSDKTSFFMNSEDAKKSNIKNNDKVSVESSESKVEGRVKISDKIPKGFVGAHFHSEKLLVNKLFSLQFDEETFIPNYKVVAVRISKAKES